MLKIEKKDMENSTGLMANVIKDNGKMEGKYIEYQRKMHIKILNFCFKKYR